MKKFFLSYGNVLLDAIIDSLKILPILLIVYYFIEFIEYRYAKKLQNNRLLKGKSGPVVGAFLGSVPQCGFSVVSTDLFSRGVLSVGTLLAVFIATSDEAIPILIARPQSYKSLLILIAFKIVIAIIVGYFASGLFKLIFKNKKLEQKEHNEDNAEHHEEHHEHEKAEVGIHDGCCHHHVESKKFNWLHPLLHSLKIFGFILIISFLFGCFTDIWVGEERLIKFLSSSKFLQPVLAVLIGLIPNCASSVVLTEFYIMGGLQFSALLAGLMVNAGLGVIFLFKQNKHIKENIFIISVLVLSALIVGYGFVWLVI